MSTIRLLANHPQYGDAGTVNTAVPFLVARELVAAGLAERPGQPKPAPAPTAPATDEVIADLKKKLADATARAEAAEARHTEHKTKKGT